MPSLIDIIASYRPETPLSHASTIPASWYTDARVLDLETRTVFSRGWQAVARVDQFREPGRYVAMDAPSGDPIVIVRDSDHVLRAFFNVCRHHAAAVVSQSEGVATHLRCPYHGWTYGLDGTLKGTPDFAGVCEFDRAVNGLVPIEVDVWHDWVFVRVDSQGPPLHDFLGADLIESYAAVAGAPLHWMERRRYTLGCNWKVFVDNYLDGGYHVPHLHKSLDSVLDYSTYTIENGTRFCLQSSPIVSEGADPLTAAVRAGDRARYYWIYPNFMINRYADAMDTNLVLPRGVDSCDVIFDFYFSDVSASARPRNTTSIEVSERIQHEDVAICESVQRGLRSRAYTAGRLSVRREAGEHLFHRLLHHDLASGLLGQ